MLISRNSENAEKKSELYKQNKKSKLELDKKWKSPSGGALLVEKVVFCPRKFNDTLAGNS